MQLLDFLFAYQFGKKISIHISLLFYCISLNWYMKFFTLGKKGIKSNDYTKSDLDYLILYFTVLFIDGRLNI